MKSFPHRKTLNLPGVLSPSPDTSLAKLEIGEMGDYLRTRRTFFFDFGKIGDYVPPNFSVSLGKLEVVDIGNYRRSCQTTVETEFGGKIGDYLQTRQIFD